MNERQAGEQKEATYFVSYASTSDHSFIIVSKSVASPDGAIKNLVIASFGLYGENEMFLQSIATMGAISEFGRIRSEHYLLACSRKESGFEGIEDLVGNPIVVKSYAVSRDKALGLLNEVIAESKINVLYKRSESEKEVKKLVALDALENGLRLHFRSSMNQKLRGGPTFNGRDYNCKKYAIQILRRVGIYDAEIEKDRYPSNKEKHGLKYAYFKDIDWWDSDPNMQAVPKVAMKFPKKYSEIFNTAGGGVKGAIALLADYSDGGIKNSLLHFKRHYKEAVANVLKNKSYLTISEVVEAVKLKISKHRDMTGSLEKRLDFLAAEIAKAEQVEVEKKEIASPSVVKKN